MLVLYVKNKQLVELSHALTLNVLCETFAELQKRKQNCQNGESRTGSGSGRRRA